MGLNLALSPHLLAFLLHIVALLTFLTSAESRNDFGTWLLPSVFTSLGLQTFQIDSNLQATLFPLLLFPWSLLET